MYWYVSDEVWRRLIEQLVVGKVRTPPAIRSLLQLGLHTRAEQLHMVFAIVLPTPSPGSR